jgi:hypothetical protein
MAAGRRRQSAGGAPARRYPCESQSFGSARSDATKLVARQRGPRQDQNEGEEVVSYYAVVKKRSWDKKPIDVPFDLPAGVTIASCTVSATETLSGSDVSGTLLVSTSPSPVGDTVTAVTQAGTSGLRYLVKYRVVFSDGSRKEKVVLLIVNDGQDA